MAKLDKTIPRLRCKSFSSPVSRKSTRALKAPNRERCHNESGAYAEDFGVMNRQGARQATFLDDDDFSAFLDLLAEVQEVRDTPGGFTIMASG